MAVSAVSQADVQHGAQQSQVDMNDPMILAMVCLPLLSFVKMTHGIGGPPSLQGLPLLYRIPLNMADKSKMDDLGKGRREYLTTVDTDYQHRYRQFGNVRTSQLEADRAINRSAGQVNADRTALSAWSSKLIIHAVPNPLASDTNNEQTFKTLLETLMRLKTSAI